MPMNQASCQEGDGIATDLQNDIHHGGPSFDRVYPEWIQALSKSHWTPVPIAREAARFLVTQPGTRVLDIGCGPGKFCAIGAITTQGHFTGVEQRSRLALIAKNTARTFAPSRIEIIHANITQISFRDFDAFYLFNPFQENTHPHMGIDTKVDLVPDLFMEYTDHVKSQLAQKPYGTRVVTYYGEDDAIPDCYQCESTSDQGNLKFWINKSH
jgi:SAM-dependent methyltransferase